MKPERDLLLAYDDPLGVTAAFNRNLLVRINRELGGDFDSTAFAHRAVWNDEAHRIEMHLVSLRRRRPSQSRRRTRPSIRARGTDLDRELHTLYQPHEIEWIQASAPGSSLPEQWIDDEAKSRLTLFIAISSEGRGALRGASCQVLCAWC